MTSEITSEAPREEMPPPVENEAEQSDRAASVHLRIALAFLAISSLLLTVAGAHLVFPDTFSGFALLSYGRLLPVAVDLLVYGWLTVGLIGAGYYILPRVTGRGLRHEGLAVVGGGVLTVGYLAGSIGVLLGANEGGQYLEFPIWADAAVVVGLLLVARVFTANIAARGEAELAPSEWFFGAAPVWLLLSHIVGNLPGLHGVNLNLQASFYRGALFGLWLATAGIGVVYFLVASVTGRDPRRITQLTVAGFWSIGPVFALAAGARLTYTTAPDWLETIGGVFAIVLFLPVAIILADMAAALRGTSGNRDVRRLLAAGAVGLAVFPIVNLGLSLRSAGTVVGMTDWVAALDFVALVGVFTFWLLAFVIHASAPPGRRHGFHFAVSATAIVVFIGSHLVAGLQTGLGWLADANSRLVSAGSAFEATVRATEGHLWVRLVALALFAIAQVWLFSVARRLRVAPAEPSIYSGSEIAAETSGDGVTEADEDDVGGLPAGRAVSLNALRAGTVGLFALAVLVAFVLPAGESSHGEATLLADSVRNSSPGIVNDGRSIYIAEGCWYCHTQEVRGIVTDVGLGPVAQPGDYALEDQATTGFVRTGPDLMFVGSRGVTPALVVRILENPREVRPWSSMPSHDYLSRSDMEALAAYVSGLDVFEFE